MSNAQFWLLIGFVGQAFFSMRFLVQWVASEKRGESVIPISFWFFSMGGALIRFTYALDRRDPVFILAEPHQRYPSRVLGWGLGAGQFSSEWSENVRGSL